MPPRPSRRGHGSPARLVQLLKHHTRRALTPEVVGFPATPPFGWLGSPRPSALWDLIAHGYFRTAAGRRDSPGLFVGGLGRHPAVPALAGGGTGAARRGHEPLSGFELMDCVIAARPPPGAESRERDARLTVCLRCFLSLDVVRARGILTGAPGLHTICTGCVYWVCV